MINQDFLQQNNFSSLVKSGSEIVSMTLEQVDYLTSKDYYEGKLKGEFQLQKKNYKEENNEEMKEESSSQFNSQSAVEAKQVASMGSSLNQTLKLV
jgi:hypothetical protein